MAVGDTALLSPNGGLTMVCLEAPHSLILRYRMDLFTAAPASERSQAVFDWTWVFVLRPVAQGCRLIVRVRGDLAPSWLAVVVRPLLEPTHLVMERKMPLGLKQRAEQATTTTRASASLQHQSPKVGRDLQREPGRLGDLPNVGQADWPSAWSPSRVGAWALLGCWLPVPPTRGPRPPG